MPHTFFIGQKSVEKLEKIHTPSFNLTSSDAQSCSSCDIFLTDRFKGFFLVSAWKSGNFQIYSSTRVKFNSVSKYLWIFIRRWSHVFDNVNLKHTFSFVVDESVCSLPPLAGHSFNCIVKTKLHLEFAFSRRGKATCNTVRLRKRSRELGLLRGNPENDRKYAKRIAFQLVNSPDVY